jgi:hypothetical protein
MFASLAVSHCRPFSYYFLFVFIKLRSFHSFSSRPRVWRSEACQGICVRDIFLYLFRCRGVKGFADYLSSERDRERQSGIIPLVLVLF